VLSETDLEDSADLSIRELSRGQRRRVLLAAAWIGTPRTAILDEPLDAMDEHWRCRIHGWLKALREAGGVALVATHEAGSLAELADRFLVLRDGEIRELDSLPQDTTWRTP
ncbi:MAG: ATP-binding cassette domain-containing protein, partial [Holophagales bacterium]|nr:ATP-binding cassette domain-containing protein [Holophagales bacterium]